MTTDNNNRSSAKTDRVQTIFDNPDDPIYGEDEAAEYLKLSRRTLQRIRASRRIRYIAYVGKALYKRSHLDEFVVSREMQTTDLAQRKKRKHRR